jgi:5-hydroxyisourate hydrolase
MVGSVAVAAPKSEPGLSTHVLDTAKGQPGRGVTVKLYRMNGESGTLLRTAVTNTDGRVPQLLKASEMKVGRYQIVFKVGPYFQKQGLKTQGTPFLDEAVVRFGIGDARQHYHVPITVTPYSYSTYRGS